MSLAAVGGVRGFWRRGLLLWLLFLPGLAFAAETMAPVITVQHGPNTPEQQAKPYVVLVSLGGFRYDYVEKYGAPHIDALRKLGASAPQGMLPVYPSLSFPNQYSMVTGLYPEHHGIVAMSFYDPQRKQRYAFDDPKAATDGSWYGGTPLWSLAEKQGMRTACFFWPGSEAEIAGERPSYYLRFDDSLPEARRLDQVEAWLRLPPERRPHFITLYYSDVDHAGRNYGPESPQTRDAVHRVDALIGMLEAKLKAVHLPVDLIVISDHGMARESGDWIDLDAYADLAGFETAGSLLYAPSEAAAAKAYQQLKIVSDKFTVYRRSKLPAGLAYRDNPRIGDPVIVANGPYAIRAHVAKSAAEGAGPDATAAAGTKGAAQAGAPDRGVHGYDPRLLPEMRAIFYAAGPDIRPGVEVRPFEDINLYPLIAAILGLHAPPVDGSVNVLSGILVRAAAATPDTPEQ